MSIVAENYARSKLHKNSTNLRLHNITVGGKSLVTFCFYKTVNRFCFYVRMYRNGTE